MSKGLGSSLDKGKGVAFDLNIDPEHDDVEVPQCEYCAICVEPLSNEVEDRTIVTMCCQHEFHLDCIGSAFNVKGKMQCPICRNIEPGRWLYANDRPNPSRLPEAERLGLQFRPFNVVPPTMPIGSLHPSPSHHSPGPDIFPYGVPMNSLFGPSCPRHVATGLRPSRRTYEDFLLSPFGRNPFNGWNGMATNFWVPNEYNGLWSVDTLQRSLFLENMKLRNQVEHSLALLASNECDINLLRSIYDGGESSRTGAIRGGGGRSSDGGGSNGGSGCCGCGGSGNVRGCMNCGRSG